MDPLLKENVICPMSDAEMERRWKAVRAVMEKKKIDFVLIQNSNDYLGGYMKWFTDMPAVHGYPASVIFPRDDEMTTISHGPSDPIRVTPAPWLLRGVKKRLAAPIMLSMNYTCNFHAEKAVEELKPYKNSTFAFANEGQMYAAFPNYIRKNMPGAKFVDITDEIDEIRAIKSPEEIERVKAACYLNDEGMKASIDAIKPGVREFEVMAMGRHRCRLIGGEQQLTLMGSSPAGGPLPQHPVHAMNRALKDGDQIWLLIEAPDASGQWAHLARVICIGKIPAGLEREHELAVEAQNFSLDMIKPGADPIELFKANNEWLKTRGYWEETRIYAHGQGYDAVERPSFQPGETMKVMANMNIAVHPTLANKNFRTSICDNYMVTETGVSECLHKTPKKIFVV